MIYYLFMQKVYIFSFMYVTLIHCHRLLVIFNVSVHFFVGEKLQKDQKCNGQLSKTSPQGFASLITPTVLF